MAKTKTKNQDNVENKPQRAAVKNDDNKAVFKIIVAACSVFLTLLIVALIINLVRLGAARSRKAALEAQAAYLDAVIDENGRLIDYCGSPEFIEGYAREYFGMVYLGEIVIGVK